MSLISSLLLFVIYFLTSIYFTFAAATNNNPGETNFFQIDFKDKKGNPVNLFVILAPEGDKYNQEEFLQQSSEFVQNLIDDKTAITTFSIDPEKNSDIAKNLELEFIKNNSEHLNFVTFDNKSAISRSIAKEEVEEKEFTFEDFNKYYNLNHHKHRRGLMVIRSIVNGTITGFFNNVSTEAAIVMGSFMAVISAGVMKYDYIINSFVKSSIVKKYFKKFEFLAKPESILRWFSLEFGVVTMLAMAQYKLGITEMPRDPEEIGMAVTELAILSLITLGSQGMYELALIKNTDSKDYTNLVKTGNFAKASKIRMTLETGKLMGSMVWAIAAVAELTGNNSVSGIAFGTLFGAAIVVNYLTTIKKYRDKFLSLLNLQWKKDGILCKSINSVKKRNKKNSIE